jgi:hypothetical protein
VKRPPDKKMMLAATILLVAASMVLARPAVGTAVGSDRGSTVLIVKFFGRS